jgi:hypothetical protein
MTILKKHISIQDLRVFFACSMILKKYMKFDFISSVQIYQRNKSQSLDLIHIHSSLLETIKYKKITR